MQNYAAAMTQQNFAGPLPEYARMSNESFTSKKSGNNFASYKTPPKTRIIKKKKPHKKAEEVVYTRGPKKTPRFNTLEMMDDRQRLSL